MATEVVNESLIERTVDKAERLFKDPGFLDLVCNHVTSGGDLVALSETLAVPYHMLCKWIHVDHVRESRIRQAKEDRKEWWGTERIFSECWSIINANVGDLFNSDNTLKAPTEWSRDTIKAIQSIQVSESVDPTDPDRVRMITKTNIKYYDKIRTIELLAKHFKMFVDGGEEIGKGLTEIAEEIRQARTRAQAKGEKDNGD